MGVCTVTILVTLFMAQAQLSASVSLYDHYVPNGQVSSGLVAEGDIFKLNGKGIIILSGSFHYFRVHPDYWRDTLKKMRAAGLNTVQTYVPWNLHEPRQGEYDFGQLGEDMSMFLDLRSFVSMAQEEDMFVIFRPGPFICAEWDFGGLPSWLLRDPALAVRSYYEGFRGPVEAYYSQLLPQVVDLQFTQGGPIISVQIENEFGSFGYSDWPRDLFYMNFLKGVIENLGFSDTLLFTSDNPTSHYDWGALPGVFQTANFKTDAETSFASLRKLQPGRPLMVTEFWTGWFDSWLSDSHSTWSSNEFASTYEYMIKENASVNMYMFIGGTNFGFMAGAEADYVALVTSYDYDAPLSEAGDYTTKYIKTKEILSRLNPLNGIVDNPDAPLQRFKAPYGSFDVTETIDFQTMVKQAPTSLKSTTGTVNMEMLDINNKNGQSYGYVLYSSNITVLSSSNLLIRGHIRDMAQVMVDDVLLTKPYGVEGTDVNSFGFWQGRDKSMNLTGTGAISKMDILVENLGRVNFGEPHVFDQRKGIYQGPVLVDDQIIYNWTITPLEFNQAFIKQLTGWQPFTSSQPLPSLYRASVTIPFTPEDTFLDMSQWNKGVVFLNTFNLGRYWSEGPTRTLYVPAPLLIQGVNEIVVFEQYAAADKILFVDKPILG